MTTDLLLSTVVQQRDLNEVEARALVDGIRVDVTDLGERIGTAYLGRAWVALGHQSWDALCEAEFDGARLRIPREQRAEQVQSLRSAGLSTRAIGSALGVSAGTVRNDLSTAQPCPVEQPTAVRSLDGRARPASQPPRPQSSPPPVSGAAHAAAPGGGEHDVPDLTGINLSKEAYRAKVTALGETVPVNPRDAEAFGYDPGPLDADDPAPASKRKPLPDAFFAAVGDLSKNVERIERLTADDRFPRNADQVAAKHRSDLIRATEALARVLDQLT